MKIHYNKHERNMYFHDSLYAVGQSRANQRNALKVKKGKDIPVTGHGGP
jgi:hypothetical protein